MVPQVAVKERRTPGLAGGRLSTERSCRRHNCSCAVRVGSMHRCIPCVLEDNTVQHAWCAWVAGTSRIRPTNPHPPIEPEMNLRWSYIETDMEPDMDLRWSKGWTRNGLRTGPETEPAIDSKRNQEIYRNRARNGPGIVPVGEQKWTRNVSEMEGRTWT